MTEPITYRRATAADILIVCELGQVLNRVHHHARPDFYIEATSNFAGDEAHWLPVLQASNRATFLAEERGTAVGFITAQVMQPRSPRARSLICCRINSVAVREEEQGRGIGRMLMRLAESWGIEQGATDIRLAVWTFNESATRLYEELGYEVRAFEMGKPLSAEVKSTSQ